MSKSKRVTLGLFKNEKKALENIEHHKKFRMKTGINPTFFVVHRPPLRPKDDKKTYEAYYLLRKSGQ